MFIAVLFIEQDGKTKHITNADKINITRVFIILEL